MSEYKYTTEQIQKVNKYNGQLKLLLTRKLSFIAVYIFWQKVAYEREENEKSALMFNYNIYNNYIIII